MNVYVLEQAKALAAMGHSIHIFTRAAHPSDPPSVTICPGVHVEHLTVGPPCPVPKEELPALVPHFVTALHTWGMTNFDVIHAHYWLSAAATHQLTQHHPIPWAATMHTLAAVKNTQLATGDQPEPTVRINGEHTALSGANLVFANTPDEAFDISHHYGIPNERIRVVTPGVNTDTFYPTDQARRHQLRTQLGINNNQRLVLFVGRIQALKGPDTLIEATARITQQDPHAHDWLRVMINGGSSGSGPITLETLQHLATQHHLTDPHHPVVTFGDPVTRTELANLYRAADVVAVPSHHETFGLVAAEAQACGTPVIATKRGGLRFSVAHGHTGVLVPDHDPDHWADTLLEILSDDTYRAELAHHAAHHGATFSWTNVAHNTTDAYHHIITHQKVTQ